VKKVVALLVGLSLMMDPLPSRASEIYRFDWLFTSPAHGVKASLALGHTYPGQYLFVSIGGSDLLDIIQIGAHVKPDGKRVAFAAWGSGVPNGVGSFYREIYLGSIGEGPHKYEIRLVDSRWFLRIDGETRKILSASLFPWEKRSSKAAIESHNSRLGGTAAAPAKIRYARVFDGSVWRMPRVGYWYQGGSSVPARTRERFGDDWLEVWRV